MPPADAACTSESGAIRSATTYSTQPPMPPKKPSDQRPLRKSDSSERSGRRSDSGGSARRRRVLQRVAAVDGDGGHD